MIVIAFEFNTVNRNTVTNVDIIPSDSREWMDFLNNVRQNKSKGQKEREQLIQKNTEKFHKFKNTFELIESDPLRFCPTESQIEEAHSEIKIQPVEKTKYDFDTHGIDSPFKAKDDIKSINGWKTWDSERKLWLIKSEDKNRFQKKLGNLGWTVNEPVEITFSHLTKNIANHLDHYKLNQLRNDLRSENEKQQRKGALRLAYIEHLSDIVDWNYNRMEAFLRDLESQKSKDDIKPGKGGNEFEEKVVKRLEKLGFPIKNTVFRIERKNKENLYKEMDVHTEIKSTPLIIEIYTQRHASKKQKQLNDYKWLYEQATGEEPLHLLLTDSSYKQQLSLDLFQKMVDR